MQCTECGKSVGPAAITTQSGVFCNNLCRHIWNKKHGAAGTYLNPAPSSPAQSSSSDSRQPISAFTILRIIGVGFLWLIVLYFLSCTCAGMIAGGIAGAHNPQNAGEAGRIAGAEFVAKYRLFIIAAAALCAVLGSVGGLLPGTGLRKTRK